MGTGIDEEECGVFGLFRGEGMRRREIFKPGEEVSAARIFDYRELSLEQLQESAAFAMCVFCFAHAEALEQSQPYSCAGWDFCLWRIALESTTKVSLLFYLWMDDVG